MTYKDDRTPRMAKRPLPKRSKKQNDSIGDVQTFCMLVPDLVWREDTCFCFDLGPKPAQQDLEHVTFMFWVSYFCALEAHLDCKRTDVQDFRLRYGFQISIVAGSTAKLGGV